MAVPRPHVVVHVAVSLDGATTGFDPDVGRFYALAGTWHEDVTLAGADTILAQERALVDAPRPGPAADGPLLAVVDGQSRVRQWDALRDCGYWSGVLALRAAATPATAARPAREIVTGEERVDLAAALGALGDIERARVVRVDSGGALIGALLAGGLVDELSLLVHPCLAGAGGRNRVWHGPGPLGRLALEQLASEAFDDGIVWLRYRALSSTRSPLRPPDPRTSLTGCYEG
jgi:2,5-diamino-6-(ribosylamino)-4(3H)-pyrimidinone 5'-phosphate reductase